MVRSRSTAHTRCRHPARTASGSQACGWRSSSCSRPPSLAREMVRSRSTACTPCRHPVHTASGSQARGWRSSSCSRPPSLAREMGRSTACSRCRLPARTALGSQACGSRSSSCRRHWPERGACRQVIRGGLLGCEDAFSRLGCLENEQREHGAAQHLAWFAETRRFSIY